MSLADSLAAPTATKSICPIPAILDRLPERDADALRRAFEPTGFSRERIHAALRREGVTVTREAIGAHRTTRALAAGMHRTTLPCSCHSQTT